MIVRSVFALILIVCLPAATLAQTPEKRVALVIANANYQNASPLTNPLNDAKAMATTLVKIGFAVDPPKLNLNQAAMVQALTAFAAKARDADVAVVYYAGHGLEIEGKNYLIPIDAKFDTANDVDEFTAVSLDLVLKSVGRAKRLKLVILDACRNNPFASKWRLNPGGGKTRDFGARGLAPVPVEGDTLVAFAAEAGTTAQDGPTDGNSPFVRALTKYLPEPGVDIRIALGKVRDAVVSETKVQKPFTYGSIGGQEFYLVPKGQRVVGPDPAIGKKPGESFRDCPECPEMVIVPAGKFVMGSPATEKDRDDDEGPQREVTIAKPFAVGKFEVTFAEWDACVKDSGCKERTKKDYWGRGKQPLINVSWDEAHDYLEWIKKLTGRKYRLLSESEWEYTARARTTNPFSFGNTISTSQANYDGNYTYGNGVKGEYRQRTVAVGSFPANAFGLHDMHGNVWEWVEDCWNGDYRGAPVHGSARTTGACDQRLIRGGSWSDDPRYLRSAYRYGYDPGFRMYDIGFRLARDL
jgi:formylglycine-generating enzyme required for sulfatase activity